MILWKQWAEKLVEDAKETVLRIMDVRITEIRRELTRMPSQYIIGDLRRQLDELRGEVTRLRAQVQVLDHFTPRVRGSFGVARPVQGGPHVRLRPRVAAENAEPEYWDVVPICGSCKRDL